MNALHRHLAPISAAAWQEIDAEARRVLELELAGRKLVDFEGPLGWEASAVNLGRQERLRETPVAGVEAARRRSLPLVELRTPFALERAELDAVDRGCEDPELGPVVEAASRMAAAEDGIVFHGYAAAGLPGMATSSEHPHLAIPGDYARYPEVVAEATRLLREAGVAGPYAIALGPRCYTGLLQATAGGGYPVLEIVRKALDGPIVWAPAADGAFVVSLRGGDFALTVGQDLSIGYVGHDDREVRLYLVETVAFRVPGPEAAVNLSYRAGGGASGGRKGARKSGRKR